MTPWRKTRVKTQAKTPAGARRRRPETSSAAAIRLMVNSEEWTAANDVAPGETKAANPVPMAAANDAAGEAVAIQMANGQMANAQTASKERWAAASGPAGEVGATAVPMAQAARDAAGEAEATAVPIAQAAERDAPGETVAIKQTVNRERLTALGGQGRTPTPQAPARLAALAGGAIRRAEAPSLAPMERAIAPCHQPRHSRK